MNMQKQLILKHSRGAKNRTRILKELETPKNANQLKNKLNLNYRTVTHHLDVLEGNGLICSYGGYGRIYMKTEE